MSVSTSGRSTSLAPGSLVQHLKCVCMPQETFIDWTSLKKLFFRAQHSLIIIRDRGSDLYIGIDMVKNYCLYKWYGRCSAKKGQKLSQITPN